MLTEQEEAMLAEALKPVDVLFGERGTVYFVQAGDLPFVKIGCAGKHPQERVYSLQIGCPLELRLLSFVSGGYDLESHLHTSLRPLHFRGEWFHLTPTVVEFMERLKAAYHEYKELQAYRLRLAEEAVSEADLAKKFRNSVRVIRREFAALEVIQRDGERCYWWKDIDRHHADQQKKREEKIKQRMHLKQAAQP